MLSEARPLCPGSFTLHCGVLHKRIAKEIAEKAILIFCCFVLLLRKMLGFMESKNKEIHLCLDLIHDSFWGCFARSSEDNTDKKKNNLEIYRSDI